MNASGRRHEREGSADLVAIGSGWLWPAALVTLYVALAELPVHGATTSGSAALAALLAALYVTALSVGGVRLLRGGILRKAGSRAPIVLLGRGPDPITSAAIDARWRLAAVFAGTLSALVVALAAAQLAATLDPSGYPHAVASLTLGVNIALVAGSFVPAPGLSGWALLLGVVDARGTRRDRRIQRAAHLARGLGVPILAAVAIAAATQGDSMLFFAAVALSMLTWARADLAAERDAAQQFLAGHRAGDIARPVTTRTGPGELVDDLRARLPRTNDITIVEANGGVIGAVGPAQVAARRAFGREPRCRDVMVPLAELLPVSAGAPAVEIVHPLARHGFALIAGGDGLGSVEASDLGREIRVWVGLRDRPHRRVGSQPWRRIRGRFRRAVRDDEHTPPTW